MKRHNLKKEGSSTLEIVIALAIITITMTGVITVAFGNQNIALDTRTNNDGTNIAQREMEEFINEGRESFIDAVSTSLPVIEDIIYTKKIDVVGLSQCAKRVTSTVKYFTDPTHPQTITLESIITDLKEETFDLYGEHCDGLYPFYGYEFPVTATSRDLIPAGNKATGLDVIGNIVFMSAGAPPGAASNNDLFVLDATDAIFGATPNILSSLNTGFGIYGIDVADGYAYVANNFYTTTPPPSPQDLYSDQLQIFDVSDINNPPILAATMTLPNVDPSGSYPFGKTIHYHNKRVYIGLNETMGDEFHIVSVDPADGASPINPIHKASINIKRNINSIAVRDGIAYLATGPGTGALSNPLKIYDVDPSSPTYLTELHTFKTTETPISQYGAGTGLYLLGNRLYLGRERVSSDFDFYILDISSPSLPSILGSKNLGLHSGAAVSSIRANGELAFLGTTDSTDGFQVYKIANPAAITRLSSFNYSQVTTRVEYENGLIYTSNRSNDALRIIKPAQCADNVDNEASPDGKIDAEDPQCHSDGNAANPASYVPSDNTE